ncbi:MAG: ComEC/Rec2 family competence protein [Alphaproteobacteria bacterium]
MQRFLDWRFGLTDSIIRTLGPHDGPIAAGLITGEARAIPQADFAAFRASNLYHIIAISGEHMVVVGGAIFFLLRLLLLAFPIGQKPLGKSIAAAVTLVLTTLYLGVTGMPISAVRAYIMMALVLLAIIAGRRPNGMRSLAIAFWLMLLIQPADLFDPGFELSFAASMALIALIESAWYPTVGKRETLAGTLGADLLADGAGHRGRRGGDHAAGRLAVQQRLALRRARQPHRHAAGELLFDADGGRSISCCCRSGCRSSRCG